MCGLRRLTHHSYANLDEIVYEHLHWVINIDFDKQNLRGTAEYTFTITKSVKETPVLILDTNHLTIEHTSVDGVDTKFTLKDEDPIFGTPLVISLPTSIPGDKHKVKVEYVTTSASSGLQWLSKELTAGKTHPYLFTQCQAIHARSIIPVPDTPACKFTYSANVTTPKWCTCLLSAIASGTDKSNAKHRVASFRQDVPIPAYLLAIVAGKLESRELGPRSRVWAETSVVDQAAFEFAQTEDFLRYAEEITGQPYVWKRYDLVCLPPSFPYGGMENPCLTFVTPTLLAGDRSLADVVAHEIAHSWTGNLVTNHSWNDFWLNEGWTVWLERKIMTRIYNDPLVYDLKATIGLSRLIDSITQFGKNHPYTHLVPDSDGVDPDDVFSGVPYEKGFMFLNYLTNVVGGHDVFEGFAKAYIQQFKFKTLTTDAFCVFFNQYFTEVIDRREAIKQIEWDLWLYSPGMPHVMTPFDSSLASSAILLGELMATTRDTTQWGTPSWKDWQCTQWVLLQDTLLTKQQTNESLFTPEHLDVIDNFLGHYFTTSGNSEIRFRWYMLTLRARDDRQHANIAAFLGEQGRMKYVRPLFRALIKYASIEQAKMVFASTKERYHPICAKMVQRDLDDATKLKIPLPIVSTMLATLSNWLNVSESTVPIVLFGAGAMIGITSVLVKRY